MAIFTVGGRTVISSLLKEHVYYLGVGRGLDGWDSALVPPSAMDADLVEKVGATKMRQINFASPSEAGEISMADGSRFTLSTTTTRYLYLTFKLDLPDASGNLLRECGIFFGLQVQPGAPSGKFYFAATEVASWGTMIHTDRFNSINRDGTIEQTFSFILTL